MNRSTAEIVREYDPFPGAERVHGVTYDGEHVWFVSGDKLNAFHHATARECAGSMSQRTRAQHSMGSTCFRSLRIASRKSIRLRGPKGRHFVIGVTRVDGELWRATAEGDESDLRRIDPRHCPTHILSGSI